MVITNKKNKLSDLEARTRALDPSASFIVQAPAGSGKTELLTQRFLVLLNYVNSPEEILAITFTKKAANEMRLRIINTLKEAEKTDIAPDQEHKKKTWHLARAALKRNQKFQWNLLFNPNRLRIQTIDSFNTSLTKRLPILSQFGASPEIATEPYFLYQEAVEEFLSHLEENVEWSKAIAQLLLHVDNNLSKVHDLLITMLQKRDQWLSHITINSSDPLLRKKLENSLYSIITDTLSELNTAFPKQCIEELKTLIRFSQENKPEKENIKNNLGFIFDDSQLTVMHAHFLPVGDDYLTVCDKKNCHAICWSDIADFLFTADNAWRKRLTIKEGFPAPGKNLHFKDMKDRATALIDELSQNDELQRVLENFRSLPSAHYTEPQWNILEALHFLLRICVAHLRIVFQKHGKIDYIENAFAALYTLGEEDSPTDIALALDYRIQHILVDEFQDTANMQYMLLQKLTLGWGEGDGRTLFVVGDPMQSIYRFREAEVGLFIRTQKIGLGHIYLEPLTLSTNFRSTVSIVNWINNHFKKILPPFEDIATGAVSYSNCEPHINEDTQIKNQNIPLNDKNTPINDNNSQLNDNNTSINNPLTDSAVELHPFIDDNTGKQQANKIIELIYQTKKNNPDGKIAILVRTRTHLKSIIPALKQAKLAYRAIKIDSLSLRPTIQDLMALTRALLHLTDRIAWLAILRAPWCGLTLNDLLLLSGPDKTISLWEKLQSPDAIASLSNDGKQRLKRILPILKEKISERRRLSLRESIESTWIMLGGPACVSHQTDLNDVAAYFNLLEKLDVGSDIIHLDNLDNIVKQLYASPDNEADEKLQIMTIHNAKGLEFDTVILPHLERIPSGDEKQLLLWMQRPSKNGTHDLIIAPINATGEEVDPIYHYIKRQIKNKAQYEDGRLLYVAATRAKQKLHLLFSMEYNKNNELKPSINSLLDKLWPSINFEIDSILSNPNLKVEKNSADLEQKSQIEKLTLSQEKNMQQKNLLEKFTFLSENTIQQENPACIMRLVNNWNHPLKKYQDDSDTAYQNQSPDFILPDKKFSITGTVLHQIFQQLSLNEINWWNEKSNLQQKNYIQNQLIQMGLLKKYLKKSIEIIFKGINNVLNDERGVWILKKHIDAKSEFSLTAQIKNEVKNIVVDRTFIDETGTRWIIDYKSSILSDIEMPDFSNQQQLNDFLDTKQKKHEKQLLEYCQAMKIIDSRPIRAGLYFPLIPAWREWTA